jgi:hypothetical protein
MTKFPIYRKYPDNKSIFKILSLKEFEEIKTLGKFYFVTTIEATQYPEMVLIKDMINLEQGGWMAINENEFDDLYQEIKDKHELKIW